MRIASSCEKSQKVARISGALDALEGRDDVFLHVYGKAPREGRKLGHVTVVADTGDALDGQIGRVLAVVGDRSA